MTRSQQMAALSRLAVTTLVAVVGAVTAVTAQAAYIINATETGGDVVFMGSGSLDLTAWTYTGWSNTGGSQLEPDTFFYNGGTPQADGYGSPSDYTGPTSIGPGSTRTYANLSTGDITGLSFHDASSPYLYTPQDWTNGAYLEGSSTYAGKSFESLGLATGAYTWSWGSDASADSLTLNVGAVPIPAAVWLFGSGLLGLVGVARRKARA